MKPLRVVLDARLTSGMSGGVESVVIGLASGLSALKDGDEEYRFLTIAGGGEWLEPFLHGPCTALPTPAPEPVPSRPSPLWRRLGARIVPSPARRRLRELRATANVAGPPPSNGTIERVGADIMHFTFQEGFLTEIPSIYHPHDLQHVHLPQYMTRLEVARRERLYRTLCEQARMVAVASTATRQDVMEHFRLSADKVRVVPLAPAIGEYGEPTPESLQETRRGLDLPSAFILYPAQTWPHKNHLGLLEALASLRDRRDMVVPLVCTGSLNWFAPRIERRVQDLGLTDQVRFLAFVTPAVLRDLYHLATAVVVPSMFEAASAPVWEAFLSRVPAACSNVTSLPDQVGDAALLFDPRQPNEIADAVARLWSDAALRAQLVERGAARVAAFTWDRSARIFRAHYRRLGGRPLIESDQALLAAPPAL